MFGVLLGLHGYKFEDWLDIQSLCLPHKGIRHTRDLVFMEGLMPWLHGTVSPFRCLMACSLPSGSNRCVYAGNLPHSILPFAILVAPDAVADWTCIFALPPAYQQTLRSGTNITSIGRWRRYRRLSRRQHNASIRSSSRVRRPGPNALGKIQQP